MRSYTINNSSGSKIEGKFYPLQTEEHLRACKELTPSQRGILYYLKTLDPYGNKPLNISVKELAAKFEISIRTVSRALKALDAGNWIDLMLVTVRVRVLVKKGAQCDKLGQECLSEDIGVTQQDIGVTQQDIGVTQQDIGVHIGVSEPLPHKGFKISKNTKNIKTNKISLSEDKSEEREKEEKFMEFAMRKVDQLKDRPALPKKWIHRNYEELRAEYEELEQQREANEERIRKTIEKPQDTGLDPIIAAGLASGKILRLDPVFKGLWDDRGVWHHQHEWIELEKLTSAES